MSASQLKALARFSACDIADALLKLHVPGAGFLADIAPLSTLTSTHPTTPPKRTVGPANTILFTTKSTPSFPSIPPTSSSSSSSAPAPAPGHGKPLPKGTPYADTATPRAITLLSQPNHQHCAVLGGINAARIAARGALGIVVAGRVRDVVALRDLKARGAEGQEGAEEAGEGAELPVWAKGTSAVGMGAQAVVEEVDGRVWVGEVGVDAGDIILLDPAENAAVAIPRAKVDDVLELLPKLTDADEKALADVLAGGTVKEAFAKYRG